VDTFLSTELPIGGRQQGPGTRRPCAVGPLRVAYAPMDTGRLPPRRFGFAGSLPVPVSVEHNYKGRSLAGCRIRGLPAMDVGRPSAGPVEVWHDPWVHAALWRRTTPGFGLQPTTQDASDPAAMISRPRGMGRQREFYQQYRSNGGHNATLTSGRRRQRWARGLGQLGAMSGEIVGAIASRRSGTV